MDYKKEIIEMLDKIKVDQILRYIYIIISDILKETEELCDLYYSQKSVSTLQLDIINFVSRIYSKETLSFLYGTAKTAYEYELKQEDEN